MGKKKMAKLDIQITDDEIGEFADSLRPTKAVKGFCREQTSAGRRHEAKVKMVVRTADTLKVFFKDSSDTRCLVDFAL